MVKRRLNQQARTGDPIAALSRDDPHHVVSTLQALARFHLKHRGAQTPPAESRRSARHRSGRGGGGLPDAGYPRSRLNQKHSNSSTNLRRWRVTTSTVSRRCRDFPTLWRLAHPQRLKCMRRHTFDLLTPKTKTAWDGLAGKERGAELNEEASRRFARVDHCFRVLLGRVATALVAVLSAELDEVSTTMLPSSAPRRSSTLMTCWSVSDARARA